MSPGEQVGTNPSLLDVTTIMQELRELRQRIDDGSQVICTSYSIPSSTIVKEPARSNRNVRETSLPSYNGDKTSYPAWRRAILTTLGMDWTTFGYTNKRAFLMIYNSLEDKAKKQVGAYYESGGKDGKEDPEDFITFLDQSNWDTTRIARARTELSSMKMGSKQRWNSFFSSWSNKLTESQGDIWPDDTKVTMLRGTLNYNLRLALANNYNIPLDNFSEFTRIVSQIALQHEELNGGLTQNQGSLNNSGTGRGFADNNRERYGRDLTRSGTDMGYAGEADSTGDTFMGGVNLANVTRGPNGKPLRAKWKTPAQIEALRRERRCYRCERKGCNTRICKVLPAQKPNSVEPKVNSIDLPDIPDGVCDEVDIEVTEN